LEQALNLHNRRFYFPFIVLLFSVLFSVRAAVATTVAVAEGRIASARGGWAQPELARPEATQPDRPMVAVGSGGP
jgi:hypothetical protein